MVGVAVLLVGLAVGTSSTRAAFPGANGRIVFENERYGNSEIYSARRNGGGLTNLTNHPADDFEPAYSADGTKIAFASWRDGGGDAEIFIMNADGSDPTQITHNGIDDTEPAFSPDGRQLVMVSLEGEDGDHFLLVIVDVATGGETFLAEGFAPSWSPLGDRIAFSGVDSSRSDYEVITIRPDGTDRRELTDSPGIDFRPDWSPDGTRIAFDSNRNGNFDIYVMAADGANPVRATTSARNEIAPAWAPSGELIAFSRERVAAGFFDWDIYAVRLNGKIATRVTNARGNDFGASWGVAP